MRTRIVMPRLLALALVVMAGVATTAAPATTPAAQRFVSVSGSVEVEGTSSLHDWEAVSEELRGEVVVPAGFFDGSNATVSSGSVQIPAATLASGKSRMDRLMHEALKVEEHPLITFQLETAQLVSASAANGFPVLACGELTIAGVSRPVQLQLRVEERTSSKLTVTGQTQLRMTDYGIDPPTAMLGALKTGDEITVAFRWQLAADQKR